MIMKESRNSADRTSQNSTIQGLGKGGGSSGKKTIMLGKEKQGGPGKTDHHVICVKRVDWVFYQAPVVSVILFSLNTLAKGLASEVYEDPHISKHSQ